MQDGARRLALSPQGLLWVYLAVVVATAVVAVGAILYTTARLDKKAGQAIAQADASVLVSQISTEIRRPALVLFVTMHSFSQSEEALALPPAMRTELLQGPLAGATDLEYPFSMQPLPDLTVEITDQHAFELQLGIHEASLRFESLLMGSEPGVDLTALSEARTALTTALAEYINTKSLTSFRDTFAALNQFGARLNEVGRAYSAALAETQASLESTEAVARYTTIGGLAVLCLTMAVATYLVGRVIQRAFRTAESERGELRALTESLQYRNGQLNALYNVFAEITDTLSMRYVIAATLRETQRLMGASFVTMRLLRGDQLVAVGSLSEDGEQPQLAPVPLGEGPTGRVARRGRSMRIDYGAQEVLGPSVDPSRRVESGIIVPLIVGARVVGTLGCWSSRPHAFQEYDERVLEMMASQVATAIVAADTQETMERRALSDPLTNLPNRRQLSRDVLEFARWQRDGRRAAVAMVDLDHFKNVNDDYGHKVGDVTLQKIATVMRQAVRDKDRVYRYGGEEFVIIFPDADEAEATALLERMLRAVAETPLTGTDLEPVGPVTASAGLSVMPDHGADVMELIVLADRALYQAKQAGRNRVEVWREDETRVAVPAA